MLAILQDVVITILNSLSWCVFLCHPSKPSLRCEEVFNLTPRASIESLTRNKGSALEGLHKELKNLSIVTFFFILYLATSPPRTSHRVSLPSILDVVLDPLSDLYAQTWILTNTLLIWAMTKKGSYKTPTSH